MTQMICNQAKVCHRRDICIVAKPHDYYNGICGPCHFDALAECVQVVENGFSSEADLKQYSQSAMESKD